MGKTTKIIKKVAPGIIATIYLIGALYFQKDTFLIHYSIPEYEKMYSESQYVLGNASKSNIGDGDVYTYAGIRYVKGEDPTKINFEHPPFGKYLYGISYQLFGLPNIILIPLFFISIYAFWQLASYVLKYQWSKYGALGLFLGHSTVYKEVARTMLDFPMMTLILTTTLLFCRFVDKPGWRQSLFFGLSGGLLLAVKYPIPLSALYLCVLFFYGMYQKINLLKLSVSFLTMGLVYICTYVQFFIGGHSAIDLLKFEWWRWHWYSGKTDNPRFLLLQVIFLGRYPKWWNSSNEFVLFPHWSLMWPITLILYCASWFKQHNPLHNSLFPYKLWILLGFLILLIGVYEDRFLLPFIPGFALFGAALIEKTYSEIIKR